jgi:ABC-type multidrug transport system ATPase subunit
VWDVIRELVAEGVTLLLTTQYLEEADTLADQIIVIDHGRVIAEGTPRELKEASKGARLVVTLSSPHERALSALQQLVEGRVHVSDDGRQLDAPVDSSPGLATIVVRALDAADILVDNIEVRPPSLDDVFFSLTGHPASEADLESDELARELEGATL